MTIQPPDNLGDQNRIITNPDILRGKPVVRGTRIPVTLILNLIANGYTFERIVRAYPILTDEDIRAAVSYAQTFLEDARPLLSLTRDGATPMMHTRGRFMAAGFVERIRIHAEPSAGRENPGGYLGWRSMVAVLSP